MVEVSVTRPVFGEDHNEEILQQLCEEETLDEELASLAESMSSLGSALMHERHANRMLNMDKQWLQSRKKHETASSLRMEIHEEKQALEIFRSEVAALTKEANKHKLEQMRGCNPKLHQLTSKLSKVEAKYKSLKEKVQNAKKERTALSKEFNSATRMFKLDEKSKGSIKKLQDTVEEKAKDLNKLKTLLSAQTDYLADLEQEADENKHVIALYNKYQGYLNKIEDRKQANEVIRQEGENLANQIAELIEGYKESSGDSPECVRGEIRRVEHEIIESTKEIAEKEKKLIEVKNSVQLAQKQLEELRLENQPKSIMKGRTSPEKERNVVVHSPVPASTRYSFTQYEGSNESPKSRKSKSPAKSRAPSTVASKRRKVSAAEAKRIQVVQSVEDTLKAGIVSELNQTLKSVGQPGQGMGSKLILLNRQN